MEENFTQREQEAMSTMVSVDSSPNCRPRNSSVVASFMKSSDGGVLPFQSAPGTVSMGAWTEEALLNNESTEGN